MPHPEEHRHLSFETAASPPPQDEVAVRLEGWGTVKKPLPASGERLAVIAIVFLLIAVPTPAFTQTCGWARETVTFLAKLPPDAEREPVVAEVEVVRMLSAQPGVEWFFSHLVLARVHTSIKGIEAGREIVVNTRDTLCDQTLSSGAIGRRYFIAGKFVKVETGEQHFSGRWKRDLASGGMVRDPG